MTTQDKGLEIKTGSDLIAALTTAGRSPSEMAKVLRGLVENPKLLAGLVQNETALSMAFAAIIAALCKLPEPKGSVTVQSGHKAWMHHMLEARQFRYFAGEVFKFLLNAQATDMAGFMDDEDAKKALRDKINAFEEAYRNRDGQRRGQGRPGTKKSDNGKKKPRRQRETPSEEQTNAVLDILKRHRNNLVLAVKELRELRMPKKSWVINYVHKNNLGEAKSILGDKFRAVAVCSIEDIPETVRSIATQLLEAARSAKAAGSPTLPAVTALGATTIHKRAANELFNNVGEFRQLLGMDRKTFTTAARQFYGPMFEDGESNEPPTPASEVSDDDDISLDGTPVAPQELPPGVPTGRMPAEVASAFEAIEAERAAAAAGAPSQEAQALAQNAPPLANAPANGTAPVPAPAPQPSGQADPFA